LRRKKKKQQCKVGREEDGSSSNRPELAACRNRHKWVCRSMVCRLRDTETSVGYVRILAESLLWNSQCAGKRGGDGATSNAQ